MGVWRELFSSERSLRIKCFFIGYLNLIASVVDLACHVVILATVTNFFSCDVDLKMLRSINWPRLELFLVTINIGTHGFYPFPLVRGYYGSLGARGISRCYPGMLHLHLLDVLNVLIHVLWLRLVVSYITALHKKDPDTMRMFFSLSVTKIMLQLLTFTYYPLQFTLYSETLYNSYWVLKVIDISVAVSFLLVMYKYIKVVRAQVNPAPAQTDEPSTFDQSAVIVNLPLEPKA